MIAPIGLFIPSSQAKVLPLLTGPHIPTLETKIKNVSSTVFDTNQSVFNKRHKYRFERKKNYNSSSNNDRCQLKEADERIKGLQPTSKSLKDKECAPKKPANHMRKSDREAFSPSEIESYKEMRLPSEPCQMKAHYYIEQEREVTQDEILTNAAKSDQGKIIGFEYMIDRLKAENISIDISTHNKNKAFEIIKERYQKCFEIDNWLRKFPSYADMVEFGY